LEGIRYRIGEIKIEGADAIPEKEILGQKTGDIADGRALQDCVYEKLKRAYEDKGYVQYNAEFEPEFIPPAAEGQDVTVNISITIDEGRRFKVSRIEFSGITGESGSRLIQSLSLKVGEVFIPAKLENDVKRLNELQEFSSIEVDRDVDLLTDEELGDVRIIIKVTPKTPLDQ
jgi:outer membrane protein assembly factor BamA